MTYNLFQTTLVQGTVMPQPEISALNWVQSGNSYTTPSLSTKGKFDLTVQNFISQ